TASGHASPLPASPAAAPTNVLRSMRHDAGRRTTSATLALPRPAPNFTHGLTHRLHSRLRGTGPGGDHGAAHDVSPGRRDASRTRVSASPAPGASARLGRAAWAHAHRHRAPWPAPFRH